MNGEFSAKCRKRETLASDNFLFKITPRISQNAE